MKYALTPAPTYTAQSKAQKRDVRRRIVDEAGEVLRRESERQDACGYRDWSALIEAVVDGVNVLDLRRP